MARGAIYGCGSRRYGDEGGKKEKGMGMSMREGGRSSTRLRKRHGRGVSGYGWIDGSTCTCVYDRRLKVRWRRQQDDGAGNTSCA